MLENGGRSRPPVTFHSNFIDNVNLKNFNQLHIAAAKNETSFFTAKLIENYKEYINDRDFMGATPLHHAALRGFDEICSELLKLGASTNIEDIYGQTPIQLALTDNKMSTFKILLARTILDCNFSNHYERELFIHEIEYILAQEFENGSEEIIKHVIAQVTQYITIDEIDQCWWNSYNCSAIIYEAIKYKCISVLHFIKDHYSWIDYPLDDSYSWKYPVPILYLMQNLDQKVVDDLFNILELKSKSEGRDLVNFTSDYFFYILEKDLVIAASYLKKLIMHGLNIVFDEEWIDAILSNFKWPEIKGLLDVLIEYNAHQISFQNKEYYDGNTLLHALIIMSETDDRLLEVLAMVLPHADVTIKNNHGMTPVDLVEEIGRDDIIKLFRK